MTTRHLENALPFALEAAEASLDEVGDAVAYAGGVHGDAAGRAMDAVVDELSRGRRGAVAVLEAMAAELSARRSAGGQP